MRNRRAEPLIVEATCATDLVLVAPADSYRLGAYLRAAQRLGVRPTVIGDRADALGVVRVADFGDPEAGAGQAASGADVPSVLVGLAPSAIVATDSAGLGLASRLAAVCHLPANPSHAIAASANKAAQRHAALRAGVAQPTFRLVHPIHDMADAAYEVGFPAVVKPLRSTASRGVLRVEDPLDARAAAAMIRSMVGAPGDLIVERFVAGGEVAVEGLLNGGTFHCLAIFDKPGAPQGPTFPETVLVTPSRLEAKTQQLLIDLCERVCAAVGLRHGPAHVEFRIDRDGQPQFLELAARTIGGRCASMLWFRDGVSLEELVLRQALGLPFEPERERAAVGVHMLAVERSGIVTAISGLDAASAVPGVTEVIVDVAVGQSVMALPRGDRYAGFVFARSSSPESVEASLAKAVDALRIDIDASRAPGPLSTG